MSPKATGTIGEPLVNNSRGSFGLTLCCPDAFLFLELWD